MEKVEDKKIECDICRGQCSASAAKNFTQGRVNYNICPTCLAWSTDKLVEQARAALQKTKKGRKK